MDSWAHRVGIFLLVLLCICGIIGPAAGQAAEGAAIGPAVERTAGEQTIIVQLSEQPSTTIRATDHDEQLGRLQTHATTTQSPFERFAAGTPHVEIKRSFWVTNALVVKVDTDRVPLQRLGSVDNVKRIHQNYNVSLATTATSSTTHQPQGPSSLARLQQPTGQQQGASQFNPTAIQTTDGLARINVPEAWAYTKGETASIAVIDTGVDPTHPDISIDPEHWNDWNVDGTPRDTDPQDYGSHGTHVSGTAVGGNAGGTYIGVAPNAELYHGAALNKCQSKTDCGGSIAQLYAGMEWAVEEDVDVISISLGGEPDSYIQDLIPAVRNAESAGTVVVAAAGNEGADTSISPGNIYDTISVGATTADGGVADFSSSDTVGASEWNDPPADWPDSYTVPTVVAPGSNIYSSFPDGKYNRLDGTSMATPHVSGTVALIQAASDESLSPDKIRSVLESTAVDTGDSQTRQGAGQINAEKAVQAVVSPPNFAVDIATTPTSITAGRKLTIGYTIRNTGDRSGSQRVGLEIDDTKVKETAVALDPGDSVNRTFTYQTTTTDVGTRTATITGDDDSASQTVDLIEPAIEIVNTSIKPSSATIGSTGSYTLTADVHNVSDDGQAETVTISLPTALTLTDPIEAADVIATDADGETIEITVEESDDNTVMLSMSPDTDAELRDLMLTINFTAQTNHPPKISIENTILEPDSITTGATDSFTLSANVYNVSDDGQAETITISLPTTLRFADPVEAADISAVDTDGKAIDISVKRSTNNTITLSMSPDTEMKQRDLTLEIDFMAKTASSR